MEERKTAAVVLSILAVILIIFTVIIPYYDLKKTYTLNYKTCSVDFNYRYKIDTAEDAYHSAQDELGLCLCHLYDKKPDTALAKKIMDIYIKYGALNELDTVNHSRYNNLDTVLKYRDKAFDPKILWD